MRRNKYKIVLFIFLSCQFVEAREINGFKLDDALIPPSQIFSGGPEKDGIPSIDDPEFVKAGNARFMHDDDQILGITIKGKSKAYPIKILNWHEIVNDSIGGINYVITYCPLCGTGIVFGSDIAGRHLKFGVSGLLYNSDVLLYDRGTGSLWSQLMAQAVTGNFKGTTLSLIPVRHTTWSNWKHTYPSTLLLSDDTGYSRNYNRDPYDGYSDSRHLYFSVSHQAPKKYHPKEKILGLSIDGLHKAYPFVEMNKQGKSKFEDTVNNKVFTIYWNIKSQSGYINDVNGITAPVVQSYWFAWYAFHPETKVFSFVNQ